MPAPIIALELNELCPSLLDRWMGEGLLPNFKRLHDRSHVFTTLADVEDPAALEPWIQWYSIHSGLPYEKHGVFHLTDGVRAEHEDIWRALIAAGRRVASFASMNVRPFAVPGSLFVGDPWVENGDAHPAELNSYNRFVAHNVREYSNADQRLSAADYAGFLRFLLGHGFSPQTAWLTVRQLASEKLKGGHLSYRRVAILDALQFDVFAHYYRSMRPDFASFFVNSVAHLQHSYWRQMEPEHFAMKPSEEEQSRYGDAIRYGYQAMDALVGRFLKLAERHGAIIMFQTALSQQPFVKYDAKGGQRFYRLRNVSAFLRDAGIACNAADPVMTSQYMLSFDDDGARDAARGRLEDFTYEDGKALFDFPAHETERALYFGADHPRGDGSAMLIDRRTGRRLPLATILYELDGTKSGCHHPEGALWIATGEHRRYQGRVSILDIFPTTLDFAGVADAPSERPGSSLAPLMRGAAAA